MGDAMRVWSVFFRHNQLEKYPDSKQYNPDYDDVVVVVVV